MRISDLRVRFALPDRKVFAVNGPDLSVDPGETFALVGEPGSGKGVTALSMLRL